MSRGGKGKAEPERAARPAPEPAITEPAAPVQATRAPKASNRFRVLGPISYALRGERRNAEPGDVVELSPEDATSLAHLVRAADADD